MAELRTVLALIACASACSNEAKEAAGPLDEVRIPCGVDADCPIGFFCGFDVCEEKRHPVELTSVFVELVPPEGSSYARTQLISTVEAGAALVLPAAKLFDPVVVLDGKGVPISARVAIAGEARIPGLELEPPVLVLPERPGRIVLGPGRYRAHVVPIDSAVPGMLVRAWDVSAGGAPTEKQFRLPEVFPRLAGEVTTRGSRDSKRANVRVRAFAVESGLASTEAISDELGRFELLMPKTDETSFRVVAIPSEKAAWTYEQVVVLTPGDDRRLDVPLDDTPVESRGRVRLRVLGVGANGPEPAAGLRITLTASIAPEFKKFTVEGTTGPDGTLRGGASDGELEILAAHYVVSVRSPARSPFRSTSVLLDLTGARPQLVSDAQLVLKPRVKTTTMVSRRGRAVANAQLELESASGEVTSDHSDGEGRTTWLLDPGPYLAKVFGEGVPIDLRTIEIEDTSFVDLELELADAVELGGRVFGTLGEPLADVTVGVFGHVGDRTATLGQTRSGRDGSFSMLLADRAP
ncbi:MAG: hypothetical protein HYV07_30535 [Deltaproteobacteria bacterium]|nr:hypothetical protein [Deltaproteobacteria bacterium]